MDEDNAERWNEKFPPKGTIMDEFGQIWEVTYLQIWANGKRQYTVVGNEQA